MDGFALKTIRFDVVRKVFFVFAVSSFFIWGAPVSFIYVLILLPALLWWAISREFFWGRASLPLFSYFFYVFISSFWSEKTLAFVDAAKYGAYIVLFLYACSIFQRSREWVLVLMGVLLASLLVLFFVSFFVFSERYGVLTVLSGGVRIKGAVGVDNPIYVSVLMVVVFLYFLSFYVESGWRFVIFSVICLSFMAPFQSRGPMLAFSAGLIAILMGRRQYRSLTVCLIALVMFGIVAYFNFDRFSTAGYPRLAIWMTVFDEMKERCSLIWGCGFGYDFDVVVGAHKYAQLHSMILSQFFYGGVFGFMLFGLAAFYYFLRLFLVRSPWLGVYIGGLLTLVTMRHEILSNPDISWFALWLPLGLSGALVNNPWLINGRGLKGDPTQ